jgi:pyruvate dehydrogenase E2 component (dihydrolipoamide acetyltransferase)
MASKVVPILMPQAGQTMEEGTVHTWLVGPGDEIEKGQILFEVETDKALIEVEAVESGRLARIVAAEGVTVPVRQPVAYLAEDDADVEAYLAAGGGEAAAAATAAESSAPAVPASTSASAAAVPETAPAVEGRQKVSPAARRLAEERGVDLAALGTGSGPRGRIISADVLAVAGGASGAATAAGGAEVRRPMSRMRRAIAAGLVRSKQTIPHFYVQITIDADPLMRRYRAAKAVHPCSINDLVVQACARVVREFPAMRSRIEGDEIVERTAVDIGIAVGSDDGLLVPVLRGADQMSLADLAAATRRMAEAARAGRVEGAGQGTFTISNLGMFGVESFSAIIQPPEPAILAVGAVREAPVARDGQVRAGQVMTLVLSADHRLIDGLLAAKFMARLKELLESGGADSLPRCDR